MKNKLYLKLIMQFYAFGIAAYIILGIIAVILMNGNSFQVVSNYLTDNSLVSGSFVPASRVLVNIQYKWALIVVLALSITVPAVYIYLIQNNYKKIDLHKYRIIDWLITGSLFTLIMATLVGVQEIMTLILIAVFSCFSCVLIWMAIHKYATSNRNNLRIYILGLISTVLPWALIIHFSLATWVFGGIRTPWYVYVEILIGLIYAAIILYSFYWHKKIIKDKLQIRHETYPILLNQAIKISFALVLIVGLKH